MVGLTLADFEYSPERIDVRTDFCFDAKVPDTDHEHASIQVVVPTALGVGGDGLRVLGDFTAVAVLSLCIE